MSRFVLKRLAILPLLLLGIVTIAFVISRLLPSNPIAALVGVRNLDNPTIVAAAEARWGLDKPVFVQYVTYIGHLLTGDMGTSFTTKDSVTSDIFARLPATLELTIMALIFGAVGGIVLGVISASRKDKAADHAARVFSLLARLCPSSGRGSFSSSSSTLVSASSPAPAAFRPASIHPLPSPASTRLTR